jgi:hypothetical protein
MPTSLTQQLAEQIEELTPENQRKALDFVRTLLVTQHAGASGSPVTPTASPADTWRRLHDMFTSEELDEFARAVTEAHKCGDGNEC